MRSPVVLIVLAVLALAACDGGAPAVARLEAGAAVQGAPIDAPLSERPPEPEPTPDPTPPEVEAGPDAPVEPVEPAGEDPTPEELDDDLDEGPIFADFADLIFDDYVPLKERGGEETLAPEDFPIDARDLDGQRITLAGFMLVASFEKRKVTNFMFGRFPPGCCFGAIPRYDEWMMVDATALDTKDYSPYEMISVTGVLEVGERVDEQGFVESIYRLEGEEVEGMW